MPPRLPVCSISMCSVCILIFSVSPDIRDFWVLREPAAFTFGREWKSVPSYPPQMPTALEAGTLNGHGIAGLGAAVRYLQETGLDTIRAKEQALMWAFYTQVQQIPGITVYGDFSSPNRCAIVSLNVRDYDSGEVSDALSTEYGIATRPGAHCAPLMHQALGTVEQGAVRFSFSHFNTIEEINIAVSALKELAQEE